MSLEIILTNIFFVFPFECQKVMVEAETFILDEAQLGSVNGG